MSARLSEIQSEITDARHSRELAASEIQECETALSTLDPTVPENRGLLIAFWNGKLAEERAAKSRERRTIDDLLLQQAAELSRLQSIGILRPPQPV